MITRFVRIQLIAFVVVSVLAILYLGINYVRLGSLIGQRGYTVKMQLAESGGIFTNAEVTYRGVTVGRVGELRLIPDGVEIDLNMDYGGPSIPAELNAVVANRSAVGEQYVDLRPNTNNAPYLGDNSVITKDRTATPLPVDTVLLNLDRLVTSVPTDSLQIVVDELYTAVNGTGPQLQAIIDATSALTQTATEHLPQTIGLLRDGRIVLNTVNDQSSALQSFSRDLRLLSEQLIASDGDLRNLIQVGPPVSAELSALIRDAGPGLGELIADLLIVNTDVLVPRQANIQVPLIAYPPITAAAYTVLGPDGRSHQSLSINLFDPPPCTSGYQPTPKREGVDTEPQPLNIGVSCAEPLGSPIGVRQVKPGYPYVDGRPTAVPAWVCEKYREAAANFGFDCDNPDQPEPTTGGTDPDRPPAATPALLPGLLGAPDSAGALELLAILHGRG